MLADGGRGGTDNSFGPAHFPGDASVLAGADLRMLAVDEIVPRIQMRIFFCEILVVSDHRGCNPGLLQQLRYIICALVRGPTSDERVQLILVCFARRQCSEP